MKKKNIYKKNIYTRKRKSMFPYASGGGCVHTGAHAPPPLLRHGAAAHQNHHRRGVCPGEASVRATIFCHRTVCCKEKMLILVRSGQIRVGYIWFFS